MTFDSLHNIPRLERCDFNGICDKIGSFLSPEDFHNFTLFRNNHFVSPQPLLLVDHLDQHLNEQLNDLDDSWWLQDEDDWTPYDHLSEYDFQDYIFDRSFREF